MPGKLKIDHHEAELASIRGLLAERGIELRDEPEPEPADTGRSAAASGSAEPTMDVQHVARAVLYMASLPLDANVLFLTIMATKMPYVGRG